MCPRSPAPWPPRLPNSTTTTVEATWWPGRTSPELHLDRSYEAYGKRTRETGTNDDRQRANTKDEDPTGLLNEGMRYRDLETGTWLSRDPAGFVDGPNLYAYVRANPWSKFDPAWTRCERRQDRADLDIARCEWKRVGNSH